MYARSSDDEYLFRKMKLFLVGGVVRGDVEMLSIGLQIHIIFIRSRFSSHFDNIETEPLLAHYSLI